MYHDYRQRYPRRKLFQQKEANYTRLVGRNSSLYTRFLHSLLILTGLQSGPRVSLHLSPSTDIWDTVKIPLEATVNNRTWCFSRNKFYRGGPPLYRWIPHLTPSLPSLSLLDRTVLGRGSREFISVFLHNFCFNLVQSEIMCKVKLYPLLAVGVVQIDPLDH